MKRVPATVPVSRRSQVGAVQRPGHEEMQMIAGVIRRAADQLLTMFVPKLDQPVRADDCQTDTTCFNDCHRWYRTCCLHSDGSFSCSPWHKDPYSYCCP